MDNIAISLFIGQNLKIKVPKQKRGQYKYKNKTERPHNHPVLL